MRNALVTGGAGFIGSNLCQKLLDSSYSVIAVDNLITTSGKNSIPLIKHPHFRFIKQDITKPFSQKLIPSTYKLSTIYHLACPTGVPNIKKLGLAMLFASSVGTRNILEIARKHKARVLFTSSSEVYGDPQVFPQKETYTGNVDSVGYRSPYEEGKRFAESMIITYVRKYKLNARIVRVFNTYGANMSESDTRVIPKFLRLIRAKKSLPVEGDGLQTRTFCYIDDLVSGLIMVLETGKSGEIYNLGSKSEISIIDLAKLIIKITKSKNKIKFIKRPAHDHKRRLPSLAKIEKLGWKPKAGLNEGLKRTLLWSGS